MKLYRCEHGWCGISALQVLTGLSFKTLIKMVMAARKRCPRDYNGLRCSGKKMMRQIRDGVFFSEAIEVINRRKICKTRVVSRYDLPFQKDVVEFVEKFKIGTYLILIRTHFIVIRDGLTYDNQVWGYPPWNHPFHYDTVIAYAVLDPNETPQKVIDSGH